MQPMPVAGAQEISVNVNGKQLEFDVKPIVEKGRILVPLRAIFEALGATIQWDNSTKKVLVQQGNRYVSIKVNDPVATINGWQDTMDVPARLYNNRVMVPVRFCSMALGAFVDWDSVTSTVSIYYKDETGVEVTDLKPLLNKELTDVKYIPVPGNDFWVVSENNILFFDSQKLSLNNISSFNANVKILNMGALNDGRLMIVSSITDSGKVNFDLIDSQSKTIKRVGTVNYLGASETVISPMGDVLYYDPRIGLKQLSDLWKITLDGTITRLTDTPDIKETAPVWSPDGTKVLYRAFTQGKDNDPNLSIVNADGTGRKVVFDIPNSWEVGYIWSPDGKSVACLGSHLWIITLDGLIKKELFKVNEAQELKWSPDGSKIAVVQGYEIVIGSVDGVGIPNYFNSWNYIEPAWSPDGKLILYGRYGEIWVADGEFDRANPVLTGEICDVTWLSDGKGIYVISQDNIYLGKFN